MITPTMWGGHTDEIADLMRADALDAIAASASQGEAPVHSPAGVPPRSHVETGALSRALASGDIGEDPPSRITGGSELSPMSHLAGGFERLRPYIGHGFPGDPDGEVGP